MSRLNGSQSMEDSSLTGEGCGWRCGQQVGSVGCVKPVTCLVPPLYLEM